MATLADRIIEMIQILEISDPQSAARLKTALTGASAPAPAPMPVYVQAPPEQPGPAPARPQPARSAAPVHAEPSGMESPAGFLGEITTDAAARGIVWAEVISPPLSRRPRRHL